MVSPYASLSRITYKTPPQQFCIMASHILCIGNVSVEPVKRDYFAVAWQRMVPLIKTILSPCHNKHTISDLHSHKLLPVISPVS
jgi:hypothetical protein